MRWRTAFVLVLAIAAAQSVEVRAAKSKSLILNSKHDFRAASTATIRSVSKQDVCMFCHTPHNAASGPMIWNQKLSERSFPTYSSSTLQATISPIGPQDSSKLCLSCHDGTIALGDTENDGLIQFVQGSSYTLPPSSPSNLAGAGGGFTDDHPFGFVPRLTAEIHNPLSGDAVRLDANGKIQCTSCHDPHQESIDPIVNKFLVKSNESSAICQSCHQTTGWMTSAHARPPDLAEDMRYTSTQGAHTGYVGVSKNGCESCHRPHSAEVAQRLLKFPEENTCYQCHDGEVATLNVKTEFVKLYRHPVQTVSGVHDASESPTSALYTMPETSPGAIRHSECVDCHNAHYSNNTAGQPPLVTGALLGVKGQSQANSFMPVANNEYEICFKCHGDSANKPQAMDDGTGGVGFGRDPQRQFNVGNPNRNNTRIEFAFGASYHPVVRSGNLSSGPGGEVPSLRPAPVSPAGTPLPNRTLSPSSYIYCTDCHNNDTGRNLGIGTNEPSGPHASNIPHLLERQSTLEPPPALPGKSTSGVAYTPVNYALCDKCHDLQGSIMQDRSFKHREHVQQAGAACSTCHDPHASSSPMLVNFDLSIVAPNSIGQLSYVQTGVGHGTCNLMCHGNDHKNLRF
ncbi:MAG: cytochrome c3 family protein [Terriglobales bacterium]